MTAATATATEVKKSALSDATQSLGDIIAKSVTKVSAEGVEGLDNIVEENLPPDLTMAEIKKVTKYRNQIIAGTVEGARQSVLPEMAKNKDLTRVPISFKFGDDKIDMAVEREREFNDGKGGKIKKYGYVNLSYTAKGTTNAGEFKKARQRLSDEAATLFG